MYSTVPTYLPAYMWHIDGGDEEGDAWVGSGLCPMRCGAVRCSSMFVLNLSREFRTGSTNSRNRA